MRTLAKPASGDPVIEAGPSGAAGIAALAVLAQDPALAPVRERVGFGPETRAMAIVTEGRTNVELD